jgi:hypothetical protein
MTLRTEGPGYDVEPIMQCGHGRNKRWAIEFE